MKRRYYTDEELVILKSNMFVNDVHYKRYIEYDPVFKLWCIMMRFQFPELTCKEIFDRAGFDVTILSNSLPYRRIGEWMNSYKKFGLQYFLPKDGPYCSLKKKKNKTKEDKLKLQILREVLKTLKEIDNEETR